jgi:glycosyltransferase involved in cell wall biosynthesis
MKIGFVAEPYEESNASGMGYVVLELLRYLPQADTDSEFIVYSSRPVRSEYLPRSFKNVLIPQGFMGKLMFFLRLKEEVDVLLFVAPLLPLIVRRSMASVIICQELASQKIQPSGLRARVEAYIRDQVLMPMTLARARKVIAASEATKIDLLKFYRIPEEKIVVVYDGFQNVSVFAADSKPEGKRPYSYFFFAGKVKYRKNVHGIVTAFIAFRRKTESDMHLVIAGDYGGEYYERIVNEVQKAGLSDIVHFVGYASGVTLYDLYKNAFAFVFPSINEGFGMPPIEAMSLGVPVITSNISSMAEVAGDAALLVDPFEVADIARAMERMYSDEAFRNDLIQKGYIRVSIFSWPKAAAAYCEIIRSL